MVIPPNDIAFYTYAKLMLVSHEEMVQFQPDYIILDALRRALEKADGVEDIFHKHMADPSGKYIVFCANKEHMDEMIALAPEWFYKVDNLHIYSACSDDPETSRAFAAFKMDAIGMVWKKKIRG